MNKRRQTVQVLGHTEVDKKYEVRVKKNYTKEEKKNMVIFMSEPKFCHIKLLLILFYIYICPEEGGGRFRRKSVNLN